MTILNTTSLESNKRVKINFAGGDLSSDAGLLLIREFAAKTGMIRLVKDLFKTNDTTQCRRHKDPENLLQMIFQIIAGYFEDDCAARKFAHHYSVMLKSPSFVPGMTEIFACV